MIILNFFLAKYNAVLCSLTIAGRMSPQLHATPHRRVFPPPCTNSFTAQFSAPLFFSVEITAATLSRLPSMLEYHCTRSRSSALSSIMRLTKATSPPGVTISVSEPVHVECGGRDLEAEEARREAVEA